MPQKNSHAGPKAVMTKSELEALEAEVNDYSPVRQPGVDQAVRTWFRVYHSAVLLTAAMDLPQTHPLNEVDN
jgi:hypothetical protein